MATAPVRATALLLTCLSVAFAACLDEDAAVVGFIADAGAAGDGLSPVDGNPAGTGGAGGLSPGAGGAAGADDAADGTADAAVLVAVDAAVAVDGEGTREDATVGGGDAGTDMAAAPALEQAPCWFTLEPAFSQRYAVRCGWIAVPENRAQPQGRKVRLYTAVFSARDAAPRLADPVVYLDGGPGGPGVIDTARLFHWFSRFIDEGGREVVAIDQRGTGDSLPSLICPEEQGITTCYTALKTRSDPAQYTTLTNADDIEDVRRALGYATWNLLGVSYGTRLALEVMRRHPEGIRSVILDSVVPPDVNTLSEVAPNFARTLSEIEAACDRHPTCGRAYPRFASRVLELQKAAPYQFMDQGQPISVSPEDMMYLLRSHAYAASAIPHLPELAELLRERNEEVFRAYFGPQEPQDPQERPMSNGMHYSVRCADSVPIPITAETMTALQMLSPAYRPFFAHEDYVPLCKIWDVPSVAPATFTPVKSALPTLLLSGNFDPATPPHAAARVFGTLTRASNFVVSDGAHGNFFQPCAVPTVRAFLADPGQPIPAAAWQCPAGPAQVDFLVPARRLPAPGLPNGRVQLPSGADVQELLRQLKQAQDESVAPWGARRAL